MLKLPENGPMIDIGSEVFALSDGQRFLSLDLRVVEVPTCWSSAWNGTPLWSVLSDLSD